MGMQIGFPPGGSSPGGGGSVKPFERIAIAAVDTPASMKAGASVVCTGVDDQTAINAFLATYSGDVEFLPGGFNISAPIALGSNTRVFGHGAVTIITWQAASQFQVGTFINADKVGGNTDITIGNLRIEGNTAAQSGSGKYICRMEQVTNLRFDRILANDIQGFEVKNGNVAVFDYCKITNLQYNASSLMGVSSVTFSHCEFDGGAAVSGGNGVSVDSIDAVARVADVRVENCLFRNLYLNAVYVQYADRVVVTGNTTANCTGYGAYLYENKRMLLTDNDFEIAGGSCVYIDACDVAKIADNNLIAVGTSGDGLYVFGGLHVSITGNTVKGFATGISVSDSRYPIITGNHVFECDWHGIYSNVAVEPMISDNDCRGNGKTDTGTAFSISAGIAVKGSNNTIVMGNRVRKDTAACSYGIWIDGSNGCTVSNNDAYTGGTKGLFVNPASTGTEFGAGNRLVTGAWLASGEA